LLGFADPIRAGVPGAVAACHEAGIRVVMITGDYPATARAIARQIGLAGAASVLTGAELDGMDDAELTRRSAHADVFARVVPEQKLRIVRALSAAGEVVAMTGDGVNDAPALRAADIGIAMGKRGTDVARESADLVLVDDDFTSIATAIRLGRRIYDNIRKALRYVVSIHLPIAGLSLIPVLLGWPLVLLPLHIVFLELIIDPACSIAFEAEPEEPDVMRRPPRPRDDHILDWRALATAIAQGGLAVLVLGGVLVALVAGGYADQQARTVVFSALILANLGLILTSRSGSGIDMVGLSRRNWPLWAVLGGALAVLAAIVSLAPLREIFRLAPPSAADLAFIAVTGVLLLVGFETLKLIVRAQDSRRRA
jgi:Ca2+-transporting ATPase